MVVFSLRPTTFSNNPEELQTTEKVQAANAFLDLVTASIFNNVFKPFPQDCPPEI